jgi:hypothetical protein
VIAQQLASKGYLTKQEELSKQESIDYLKQAIASETLCYGQLLLSQYAAEYFKEHPELGYTHAKSQFNELNPGTDFATLRFSVSLDGAAPIQIGSANCFVRKDGDTRQYYKYFMLDHVRSYNIQLLLNYAEKYWMAAIDWDGLESTDFKESLARLFWALRVATPYVRGNEPSVQWMLALMARYHGKELIYGSDFEIDMLFAMPPEEFADYFRANTCVLSLPSNKCCADMRGLYLFSSPKRVDKSRDDSQFYDFFEVDEIKKIKELKYYA